MRPAPCCGGWSRENRRTSPAAVLRRRHVGGRHLSTPLGTRRKGGHMARLIAISDELLNALAGLAIGALLALWVIV
jgi:hypothetical protein